MNEVWENAVTEIKKDLYRTNTKTKKIAKKLTAYEPYNYAYEYQ